MTWHGTVDLHGVLVGSSSGYMLFHSAETRDYKRLTTSHKESLVSYKAAKVQFLIQN